MELLNKTKAPFGNVVWEEIDKTLNEYLSKRLNLRSVIDFNDTYDFDTDSISTKKISTLKNDNGLTISKREPISMVEIKKIFSLSKNVIQDIQRGMSDYDDSSLREVSNDFSQIENSIILSGLSGANIDGIITNSEIKSIEVKSTKDILAGVAKAMGVFNKEFVSGTFKLVVSSQTLGKLYTEFFDGFSVKTKLDDILGSNEIIVNQTIGDDKALLISQRGGDFEFYSGLDVCVGFEKELDESIELFLLQTLSFRVINPEAAILLNLK